MFKLEAEFAHLVLFSFPYLFKRYEKINSLRKWKQGWVENSAVSETEEFSHCHGNIDILATAYWYQDDTERQELMPLTCGKTTSPGISTSLPPFLFQKRTVVWHKNPQWTSFFLTVCGFALKYYLLGKVNTVEVLSSLATWPEKNVKMQQRNPKALNFFSLEF